MAGEWFCKVAGRERGPLNSAQLKSLANHGKLHPHDLVRQGTDGPWVPADRVKGLFPDSASKQPLPVARPLDADPPGEASPEPPPIQIALRSPLKVEPNGANHDQPTRPSIHVSPVVQALAKQSDNQRRMRTVQIAGMAFLSVVVIVLAVVGYVLWRQGAPPEEPAAATPLAAKPAAVAKKAEPPAAKSPPPAVAAKPKPAAEIKWYNAASDTASFPTEQVSVKVRSANVAGLASRFAVRDATKKYLVVTVMVQNHGTTRKLDFESWGKMGPASAAVTLGDEHGNRYKLIRVQGEQSPSIYPGKDYTDEVIFEPPIDSAKTLRLVLPATAFGGKGEVRFEIPRAMIATAPEPATPAAKTPATPQVGQPADKPATAAKPAGEPMPAADAAKASKPSGEAAMPDEIAHPLPINLEQPGEARAKKDDPARPAGEKPAESGRGK